jgi:3-hydroxy-3-methylglutaryl CoA synthase
MLVGPDAPLVLEPPPWRGHFSAHAFDFFKPLSSPAFPVVDGPATLLWYTRASDACGAAMYEAVARAGCGGRGGGKPCSSGSSVQQQQQQQQQQQAASQGHPCCGAACGALLPHFSYYLGHAPFNKLVRKTFARLALQDALRCARSHSHDCSSAAAAAPPVVDGTEPAAGAPLAVGCNGGSTPALRVHGGRGSACVAGCSVLVAAAPGGPEQDEDGSSCRCSSGRGAAAACSGVMALPPCAAGLDPQALPDSSTTDKALEGAVVGASAELYDRMAAAGTAVQRRLGNLYTASLYSGLAGLLEHHGPRRRPPAGAGGGGGEGGGGAADLAGRRLLLFSYGSGVQASLFALQARAGSGRFTLGALVGRQDVGRRLDGRLRRDATAFDAAMAAFQAGHAAAPFEPQGPVAELEPGTVYLERVDAAHRRHYARTPLQ